MKRPNGVGDLQKGERYVWFSVQPAVHSSQSLRYVNMDYLFISTLRHSADIVELVVSYDIVCQWSRNFWERMAVYSHSIRVDHTGQKNYHFLIPKFHLPAHIKACQTVFSFNFNRHVGRTDGEAPERAGLTLIQLQRVRGRWALDLVEIPLMIILTPGTGKKRLY